mmetsp:Transcript_22743/g.69908  ORF Transcript_22743/g.69908 Transcript_22743/m.69908 type:complete len:264 (-) Transcript_22743:376-1167(-)
MTRVAADAQARPTAPTPAPSSSITASSVKRKRLPSRRRSAKEASQSLPPMPRVPGASATTTSPTRRQHVTPRSVASACNARSGESSPSALPTTKIGSDSSASGRRRQPSPSASTTNVTAPPAGGTRHRNATLPLSSIAVRCTKSSLEAATKDVHGRKESLATTAVATTVRQSRGRQRPNSLPSRATTSISSPASTRSGIAEQRLKRSVCCGCTIAAASPASAVSASSSARSVARQRSSCDLALSAYEPPDGSAATAASASSNA